MKTLKIFLRLKKEEIIYNVYGSRFNSPWEPLAMVVVAIIACSILCTIGLGIGSYIWWCQIGKMVGQSWEFTPVMNIGVLITVMLSVVAVATHTFCSWVRDNWLKAKELSHN